MFIYVRIPLVRDSFITCVVSLKKIASENRSLSLFIITITTEQYHTHNKKIVFSLII